MTCIQHSTISDLVWLQHTPEPHRQDKCGTAKHYKLNVHVSKLSEAIIQLQVDRMSMMISYSLSSRQIFKKIAILQAIKRL